MDLRNTRTTILNSGDPEAKREEIRQYFHATYSLDEQLYETLADPSAFICGPNRCGTRWSSISGTRPPSTSTS